jgi:lipopolysaccharide transport system ATP-binding protein
MSDTASGGTVSDIAIKAEHLSKMYRLGVINNGTLFMDIQTWIALKRGKEVPHSRIGENKYNNDDDHFWALKDISFEIKQGDRVGIIGKNGAGKSTLLKLLSRITAPTEGTIKIRGKIASLLEVGTGFHGELTGRENIYLNGAILGMKKRRITEKMDEIIAFSGIEHHIDTPVKRYSSGMYVRLVFAVAAHLDSDILIADEVLAVGDAEFQKKALGKMQDLSTGQGRTVLFVSHNMGAVKNLCNCGMVLNDGRVKINGSIPDAIAEYYSNYALAAHFSNLANKKIAIPDLDAELKVAIITNNGIHSFESFSIEINVHSQKLTKNVGIMVMISDDEHRSLFYSETISTDRIETNINMGYNKFICHFPQLPLASGKYWLGIGLDEPFIKWYYFNTNLLRFDIPEEIAGQRLLPNVSEPYGIAYLPHEWKIL